jgi:hypothetical protein
MSLLELVGEALGETLVGTLDFFRGTGSEGRDGTTESEEEPADVTA